MHQNAVLFAAKRNANSY